METVETAPRPEKATMSPAAPVAVQIDLSAIPRAAPPNRRRYWLGLTPDAPMDHDARGGVEFQKFDRYPEWDENGALKDADQVQRGKVLELTDAQVELIKTRVANVVIRVGTGPDGRRTVLQKIWLDSTPNYIADARDVPAGHFMFMLPVGDSMPVGWRDTIPAPMVPFASMIEAQARPAPGRPAKPRATG